MSEAFARSHRHGSRAARNAWIPVSHKGHSRRSSGSSGCLHQLHDPVLFHDRSGCHAEFAARIIFVALCPIQPKQKKHAVNTSNPWRLLMEAGACASIRNSRPWQGWDWGGGRPWNGVLRGEVPPCPASPPWSSSGDLATLAVGLGWPYLGWEILVAWCWGSPRSRMAFFNGGPPEQ